MKACVLSFIRKMLPGSAIDGYVLAGIVSQIHMPAHTMMLCIECLWHTLNPVQQSGWHLRSNSFMHHEDSGSIP